MDPDLKVDARGNGFMSFYAFGRSWEAELYGWRVKVPRCVAANAALGPPEEPSPARVTNWAQLLVNRYFKHAEATS